MIRSLVIENETNPQKCILPLIKSFSKEAVVVGHCTSIQDALILIKHCEPELIFLDVELEDGTGFDLLHKLQAHHFRIVFVSAYKEYAIEGLQHGAQDYLIKPVERGEVFSILKKVEETQTPQKKQFVLRLSETFQIIRFEDLVYCQSDAGYTTFYLQDKRKFTASKSIKEYEKILPIPIFFRTHQSYIVNMNYVDCYQKSGQLILKDGRNIPVSTRKKEALLKQLL